MIKILFFASIRDAVGIECHQLAFQPSLKNIDDAISQCKVELPNLVSALTSQPKIMFALNQEIVRGDAPVNDGDEIALLPPVTGG